MRTVGVFFAQQILGAGRRAAAGADRLSARRQRAVRRPRRASTASRSTARSRHRARATRRAAGRSLACRPDAATRGSRSRVREEDSLDAGDARLSAAGQRRRRPDADRASTGRGRKDGSFDAGIQFALERILIDPDFLFRAERDPANVARGHAVPADRSRARLAAVVLPLEQHSRTTSCSTRPRADG